MRNMAVYGTALAALALTGCATSSAPMEDPDAGEQQGSVTADIRDAAGQPIAAATATQVGDSVRVRVEAIRMIRGSYGAHIHSRGLCDAPSFEGAGPHWNPTGREHGKDNPQGMHKGDLPNLLVGSDGRGSLEITIPSASLSGGSGTMLDADGAALVIHAKADDYRTDPSGSSGARIACGTFR